MRYLILLLLSMSSACAPLGRLVRYDVDGGKKVICWEPSRKMDGLSGFVAGRLDAR